ncbi:MAG: lipopolysaccharide transport periplasmic protein LptA [Nitrospira sp.]|nr:lipopolysaccharide transport periplasmic protein LptA [bacterium]MBL7049976.1 lipopolysaccharide transport periplasmic protein LptA [Nitrospira sp.]
MLQLFFIVNTVITLLLFSSPVYSAELREDTGKQPVVITSDTLTADNKNNTAVFEGSVIAKTDDITMRSDKMQVFYDQAENRVARIIAVGSVRVNKKEKAIFSDKAIYNNIENKITFSGSPKVVDGGNLITGSKIIFHLKDDRAVVEDSKVFFRNKKEGGIARP